MLTMFAVVRVKVAFFFDFLFRHFPLLSVIVGDRFVDRLLRQKLTVNFDGRKSVQSLDDVAVFEL